MKRIKQSDALKDLYSAILNDASIKRYSLGWEPIIKSIDRHFRKPIIMTEIEFTDEVLANAILTTKGSLKEQLKAFALELSINLDTIRNKSI